MSKMKIKDLEFEQLVGKRYKNWKQFCEDNNVTYNNASSNIKAQKQELERYCKLKWIDKKEFIIKKVYDKPKANKKTQGRQGEFATLIETLLRYIPQDEYMSMSKIMLELGLVSQDYVNYKFDCKRCVCEIMYELDKPHFGVKEYNNYALGKIVHNFYMQSNFISETIKGKLDTLAKNNIIELDSKTIIKKGNDYRQATTEEDSYIKLSEEEALEHMGRKNKSDIILNNEFDDFYKMGKEILLNKYDIDLDMYYPAYKFKFIDGKRGRKASEDKIKQMKFELHTAYANKVLENLTSDNNLSSIEFINKVSNDDLEADKIITYLTTLCDILICGKPYTKYVPGGKRLGLN